VHKNVKEGIVCFVAGNNWRHSLGSWETSVLRGYGSIEGILWASDRLVFCVATEVLKAFFGLLRD